MATEDYSPTEQIRIDDPDELSQSKRIREILARRQDVLDARNRSKDEELFAQATHQEALGHYQNHLETLILELWTKFQNSKEGKQVLHNEKIAEIPVYPPQEKLPDTQSEMAHGASLPEPKTVAIHGLDWFIENEPMVSASFTYSSWNPPGQQTVIGQRIIPRWVLDKAFTYVLEFLDHTGIDADTDDDDDRDAEYDLPEYVNEDMIQE